MAALRIPLRVTPKASKNQLIGWRNARLAVKVTAAPVEGAANEAVIKLLARALKLRASDMSIASGHNSRDKVITVEGCDMTQLRERLAKALRS